MKNTESVINAKSVSHIAIRDCLPDKHKRRDNKFGVTWCVRCGQLFTVPCGMPLQESDKLYFKL